MQYLVILLLAAILFMLLLIVIWVYRVANEIANMNNNHLKYADAIIKLLAK